MCLTENVTMQTTDDILTNYEELYSIPTFVLSSPGPFCRKRRFGTTIGIRDGKDWGGKIEEVTIQEVLDDVHGEGRFTASGKFLPTLMRTTLNNTNVPCIVDEVSKNRRAINIKEALVGFGFPVSFFDGPFFDSKGTPVDVSEDDKWRFLGNSVDVKILKVLYRGLRELNFEMNVEEGQEMTTTTTTATTTTPRPAAAAPAKVDLSNISDEDLMQEVMRRMKERSSAAS